MKSHPNDKKNILHIITDYISELSAKETKYIPPSVIEQISDRELQEMAIRICSRTGKSFAAWPYQLIQSCLDIHGKERTKMIFDHINKTQVSPEFVLTDPQGLGSILANDPIAYFVFSYSEIAGQELKNTKIDDFRIECTEKKKKIYKSLTELFDYSPAGKKIIIECGEINRKVLAIGQQPFISPIVKFSLEDLWLHYSQSIPGMEEYKKEIIFILEQLLRISEKELSPKEIREIKKNKNLGLLVNEAQIKFHGRLDFRSQKQYPGFSAFRSVVIEIEELLNTRDETVIKMKLQENKTGNSKNNKKQKNVFKLFSSTAHARAQSKELPGAMQSNQLKEDSARRVPEKFQVRIKLKLPKSLSISENQREVQK